MGVDNADNEAGRTHSGRTRYAAIKISDDVHAVSYLAKSGTTLTVVLNLSTHRAIAFASGNNDWQSQTGTFEVVR